MPEVVTLQDNNVPLEERVEKMEKLIRKIYEVICERPVGAPADEREYHKAMREARNGNTRPLREFLKRTNGEIPASAGRR